MKKVLILGGSHRDIPLIQAAKELGYFVITLGDRDYYLGHNYSDKKYKVNFNDLEKVREVVKKENIDFLIPGCGEESYLNTVKLSKEFNIGNFDDLEVAKLVHNKWKFKEFCLENDISTPKGFYYDKNKKLSGVNFPIVVKPTKLSGGRGVEVVYDFKELEKSLESTSKVSDEIFLEEFIDGKLIAYSIFIQNQKIVYGFCGEDKTYLNKYLISTAFPYIVADNVLDKMKQDIEKLASLLNLVDGMFHLQILIKDNKPYIIDVTRRIPGDLYPYLIEYCDEVEYSKAVVKSYIKKQSDYGLGNNENSSFVIRHCVMSKKNGIYKDLFIDKLIEDNIIYKLDLLEKEVHIDSYLNTQVAIVFIKINKNKFSINKINELIYPIVN